MSVRKLQKKNECKITFNGFTVNEVSKLFKLTRLEVYNMIINSKINAIRTNKILIPSSELKKIAHLDSYVGKWWG
ncbi:hypothetical protein [Clostridium sp. Marseille-Q2269]|uniref:hypothetical protein n=1 Tax=Clostridium sp. Marseille-Q2269 TaxID=2942205 RepID=UPI002072DB28|nr:hypothetical protein [Clostridium sp. Marseille-Q2269]